MDRIVVATADDDLRARLLEQLAEDGRVARCCATWADTLARATAESTRLLLVDGELPGASGALLDALRRSVPHALDIRVVRGECAPIEPVHGGQLRKLVAEVARPLTERELRLLELVGLGSEPLPLLQNLAASPLPVRIQGERGTGKQWVALLLHKLVQADRPFVVMRVGAEPMVRDSKPGTVYVENVEDHASEAILGLLSLAEATGWRVVAGSRRAADPKHEGAAWTQLHLRPLRERPKDVRPLVRHYLDEYRRRLGLPTRRVGAKLWERIERYPWPGNQRELETFVVQAATSARGATLSVETLPRRVLDLLDADERERGERRAFEELVEARLRPVVDRYEPGADAPSLYRLVIDATERALLRAALSRTAGNQKAAAELLGIARNTLRERIARLDPLDEAR